MLLRWLNMNVVRHLMVLLTSLSFILLCLVDQGDSCNKDVATQLFTGGGGSASTQTSYEWSNWSGWSTCPKCVGSDQPKKNRKRSCKYGSRTVGKTFCDGADEEFHPCPCDMQRFLGDTANDQNTRGKSWDCSDYLVYGKKPSDKINGVKLIKPHKDRQYFYTYCDQQQPDGAYFVIASSVRGGRVFSGKKWADYKNGFGDPGKGEFWLGLQRMHDITSNTNKNWRLKIRMEPEVGRPLYSVYNRVKVTDEKSGYKLLVGGYVESSGTNILDCTHDFPVTTDVIKKFDLTNSIANNIPSFGIQFLRLHVQTSSKGKKFQTVDRKNGNDCPKGDNAGWWYAGNEKLGLKTQFPNFLQGININIPIANTRKRCSKIELAGPNMGMRRCTSNVYDLIFEPTWQKMKKIEIMIRAT